MRGFHFGGPVISEDRLVGTHALHIQCPWRIEYNGTVLTETGDYYFPASDNDDPTWEPDGTAGGHLQDQILDALVSGGGGDSGLPSNDTTTLRVELVRGDSFGGVRIRLTGGYELAIFPVTTRGEQWRLPWRHHFVMESGKLWPE